MVLRGKFEAKGEAAVSGPSGWSPSWETGRSCLQDHSDEPGGEEELAQTLYKQRKKLRPSGMMHSCEDTTGSGQGGSQGRIPSLRGHHLCPTQSRLHHLCSGSWGLDCTAFAIGCSSHKHLVRDTGANGLSQELAGRGPRDQA